MSGFDGTAFNQNDGHGGKSYWICSDCRSGRLVLIVDMKLVKRIVLCIELCIGSLIDITCKSTKNKMKERFSKNLGSNRKEVYNQVRDEVANSPQAVILPDSVNNLPSRYSMHSTFTRARNKSLLSIPLSLEMFTSIPHEFTLTKRGDPFVLAFDAVDLDGKILIFATEANLRKIWMENTVCNGWYF